MRGVLKKMLIAIFILQGITAFSQVSVNGYLKDKEDKSGLAYANIALLSSNDSTFIKGTTTDEKGKFSLIVPDTGSYYIRISYIGYGSPLYPLKVEAGVKKIDDINIEVSKVSQTLEGVEIVAKKPMYSYDGEKKVYNVGEDPSVQGGVANDALQNAPGVFVDMEGNITLRGVSSVEIWLNDKPSKIKAEGLKSFLQQLPANAIEKIEVITNPSARYEASGTGGIINIVTKEKIKKNQLLSFGVNGSTQPSYSPWISFNTGNDKLSFDTYLSYSQMDNQYTSESNSYLLNEGDTMYSINSLSDSKYGYSWLYGHLSMSWQIDSTLSVDLWGGGSRSDHHSTYTSKMDRNVWGGERYIQSSNSTGSGNGNNFYTGFSLMKKFKKKEDHQLMIDGYYGGYGNDGLNTSERLYETLNGKNRRYQNDNLYDGKWVELEFNYENPLGKKRKIEAGGTLGANFGNEESVVDTFNFSSGNYQYVPLYSNFNDQDLLSTALYTTYSDTLWFINYKAGLRYEYAELKMNSIALPNTLKRHYSTLFPTLHLSTKTKKDANLTASYSRRVDYPNYQMDPFIYRLDEENLSSGNPYLDPAYTDAYEFGFAKFFKSGHSISSTLYHRRTMRDITNKTEGIYDSLLNRYTTYSTYVNAGKNIFTGLDLSLTLKIKKMSRIMLSMDAYNVDINADLGTYTVDKNDLTYNAKIIYMLNYKFLRFNLMGIYRAANSSLMGRSEPTYFMNATLNADFFNKKMSVRLGMQDIFNWMKNDETTNTPTIISNSVSKYTSQYFTFGLTFRFGKVELDKGQMQNQAPMPR